MIPVMHIDVVFDTICPWCYIGKRRLEEALAELDPDDIEIRWSAFFLNPDMPSEGADSRAFIRAKFGGDARAKRVYAAIERAGLAGGIDFRFDDIAWTPNTIDSHRLIRYAEKFGPAEPTVEAVYKGYFLEGRDIGMRSTLVDIGASVGLDADGIRQYLASGEGIAEIKDQNARAHRLGISGVPAFIVDDQFSVSGAQDAQVLERLLDMAREKRREQFDIDSQFA